MAWDSKREVPWKRLLIEWAVVSIGIAVITMSFGNSQPQETASAILLGGFIYLGFGAVLAKFGYARKSLKQLRAESAIAAQQKAAAGSGGSGGGVARARPAPTKRTSTGPSQRPRKKKR